MAHYSYAQLEGLWIQAGGSAAKAPLMAAIALAESGGNPRAMNPSGASGLWQILGAPQGWSGSEDWFDPSTNARAAVAKEETQGLGAWTTYTSGAYKLYYHPNVQPASKAQLTGIWQDIPSVLPGGGFLSPGSLAGAGGTLLSAGHIISDLGSSAWWARIGKGAIGGGLIIGGVYFMLRKEGYQPVKSMVTAGGKVAEVAAK